MMGWHFTAADRCLGYGDGRIVEPGQTLSVDVDPVPCKSGLHASARIMDALRYPPGSYLWRVRLGGTVVRNNDKAAATGRTALWGFEATGTLRLFARRCALDVAHMWDPPDVVLRYLRTGDESIRAAASDAARYAARYAGNAAAWAANAAAWAARDAARGAAWAAAGAAASDAARGAANAAARSAARGAAWDAARGAAWDAARDRQNRRLTSMVIAEAKRQGVYR